MELLYYASAARGMRRRLTRLLYRTAYWRSLSRVNLTLRNSGLLYFSPVTFPALSRSKCTHKRCTAGACQTARRLTTKPTPQRTWNKLVALYQAAL